MVLLTFWPSHVFFTSLLLAEVVFTLVLTLLIHGAIVLLEFESERPRARLWILWGLGLGCGSFVRSELLVLSIVPPLILMLQGKGRSALQVVALAMLGVSLILTPWVIRNARVFGAFVPMTTGLGRTAWVGHNSDATGGYNPALHGVLLRLDESLAQGSGPAAELSTSRALTSRALAFARDNPFREVQLLPRRVFHLFRNDHAWSSWYDSGRNHPLSRGAQDALIRVGNIYYAVVCAVSAFGLISLGLSRGVPERMVALTFLCWIATFALLEGDPRYHAPLLPLLCLGAAHGIECIGLRYRRYHYG